MNTDLYARAVVDMVVAEAMRFNREARAGTEPPATDADQPSPESGSR